MVVTVKSDVVTLVDGEEPPVEQESVGNASKPSLSTSPTAARNSASLPTIIGSALTAEMLAKAQTVNTKTAIGALLFGRDLNMIGYLVVMHIGSPAIFGAYRQECRVGGEDPWLCVPDFGQVCPCQM